MNKPLPSPSTAGPAITPQAASTAPMGLGAGGPQPQPDPWTISGSGVYYAHALIVGNPAGGNKGDGTINVTGVYVNGVWFDASLFMPLTGETMTGKIVLAANPTNPMDAATKAYVDASIAALPTLLVASDAPPASPQAGQLWWNSTIGQLFIWYADPNSSQWVMCNNALNSISLDMGTY